MRISDDTLDKILSGDTKVSAEQLAPLKEEAIRSARPLQELVLEAKLVDEPTLTQLFAEYADIPYVVIDPKEISSEILAKIPERIARQYNAVIFKIDPDGLVHLAMDDPDDVQAISFIQKEIGENVKIYVASHDNILQCLENYRGDVNEELNEVIDVQREDDGSSQQVTEAEVAEDSPIAQTVNLLLEYAIRSQASDIHIEPREEYVQIRYRIDGVLKEVNRLPRNVLGALVSRIKILSNLKIDERRVPQDGRFKIKIAGKQYALRVSTLPIADGEKVVMRILDESNQAVTLKDLGYWGHSLDVINEALTEPNGMVLVTGPTGSGKSTSLFSILTYLNKPDVNISTIEDPVEYKIPGVNQTQTNPKAGMTFANGLRALLRQDPNVIMVGEIRDGETANLAVQAALTGHLVFSTLHTNNAATCLPRLLDMEIEPFLIASTVKAVVGQRLVRKLCLFCRQQYVPEKQEVSQFVELFNLRDDQSFSHINELEEQAIAQELGGDTPAGTAKTTITALWRANPKGCDECDHTGYKGRIGIYEVLGNTIPIQKMIVNNATSAQIQDQAILEGMTTMQTDGLIKAIRGCTTLQEVLRVTKE
ncbi:Type II secretion system protein E [Candidatus Saccharimonas aalborgensis]|uniref:Type II secretion system protein E n=1 Tax=Candidatus Saccharimonas aalborgensis TaxID=1332188 RepID=R4PWA5_9BACT|nr:GspE/PulE family protein [Candidatus Saccharimonas aalborgensis]MBP7775034.1 type II/IV secretion system protein [Candidatus Saccharimonas sp.]QQR50807.1 MAG: type II/IV secretion system protein [Candidatus Saccharibacteria bacterium]AGL62032.1 Type II secretion system protein E [Candidatus Saccharimonas aalborgensis]QQS68556.1 MAG: type II/IV secretion system protein [Candidatus Saccharibacteria bacterium]QQS70853.1 MAG: type II/IV secretion system protein [Candidatus Saccharibacteria bact